MSDLDDLAKAVSSRRKVGAIDYSSVRRYPKAKGPSIICPNVNCGYRGPSVKKAKGSLLVLILLFLLGVFPGFLYLIFFQGYTYICPQCGMKARD